MLGMGLLETALSIAIGLLALMTGAVGVVRFLARGEAHKVADQHVTQHAEACPAKEALHGMEGRLDKRLDEISGEIKYVRSRVDILHNGKG